MLVLHWRSHLLCNMYVLKVCLEVFQLVHMVMSPGPCMGTPVAGDTTCSTTEVTLLSYPQECRQSPNPPSAPSFPI